MRILRWFKSLINKNKDTSNGWNEAKFEEKPKNLSIEEKQVLHLGTTETANYITGCTFTDTDPDKAIDEFNKAIDANPLYIEAYIDRGYCYLGKNKYPQAIADFKKVLEIVPQHPLAYSSLGYCYEEKGDLDEAINNYSQSIESDPQYSSASYYSRGRCYEKKGDLDNAINDYSKAIEVDPQNSRAYESRGRCYEKKGDSTNAVNDYSKVAELELQDPNCHFSLGHFGNNKNNSSNIEQSNFEDLFSMEEILLADIKALEEKIQNPNTTEGIDLAKKDLKKRYHELIDIHTQKENYLEAGKIRDILENLE